MTFLNLGMILQAAARKHPNKTALQAGGTIAAISFAQLDEMAKQFAGMLDMLGVKSGAHVALMLPNVPQFLVAYYGTLYRGSVVVPLNVLFKTEEVEYHLDNSDAEVLLVWENFRLYAQTGFERAKKCKYFIVVSQDTNNIEDFEAVDKKELNFNLLMKRTKAPYEELALTNPNDTAVILYTSGTTGKPKGAELTHFNLFQNAQYTATKLVPLRSDDVLIAVLLLFHSFGQTVVQNAGIMTSCTIILQPRFDAEQTLKLMEEHKVSFFAGVPTMYTSMLHHPKASSFDLSALRHCVSGGSSLPLEVMAEFDAKYNVNILEGYGLSETSPVASFNVPERPKKAGSIGVPIDDCEMKLVDKNNRIVREAGVPGEIHIKGFNVMKGYYKAPSATKAVLDEKGWFATGDIATYDENGYFTIIDRKKDMVIRGGYNVYSREVEEVLYKYTSIAEAAVIGVPDPKLGEEVKAVVALRPGKQTAKVSDIIDFCKKNLASYKYPRQIQIVDALPKGPTGKILKRELRLAKDAEQ